MTLTNEDYQKIFVDDHKLVEPGEFKRLVDVATQAHRPLEQLLMERAFIVPSQLLQLLGEHFSLPTSTLKISGIDRVALGLVTPSFATENLVVPFGFDGDYLQLAVVQPNDDEVISAVEAMSKKTVKPYIALEQSVRRALMLYDGDIHSMLEKVVAQLEESPSSSSHPNTAVLVGGLVEAGMLADASDIHIEPFEHEVLVRLRIDGQLHTIATFPPNLHVSTVAALKIAAKLKLDQKRLPQDGSFTVKAKGQEVNVRMSTVPSLWGEKVVLRILPKESHLFDLASLGLLERDLKIIEQYAKRPYGMILTCGPTGSGKTSTLYALLQAIGADRIDIVNISTIEDPIEYTIPRVNQIQTQPDIGLDFATGLRALLRQDPDIIMVGEIRDKETASFSVRASLVGRMLLSSLHTNNAVGAIPRLLDMGIEPYLISSTLNLVIAQRLTRKLCTHCRESYRLDKAAISGLEKEHDIARAMKNLSKIGVLNSEITLSTARFYQSKGCELCNQTGYSGRTGIYEVLEISDEIREAINTRSDLVTLHEIARKEGMKTIFEDGLAKVFMGIIDITELVRVVYD